MFSFIADQCLFVLSPAGIKLLHFILLQKETWSLLLILISLSLQSLSPGKGEVSILTHMIEQSFLNAYARKWIIGCECCPGGRTAFAKLLFLSISDMVFFKILLTLCASWSYNQWIGDNVLREEASGSLTLSPRPKRRVGLLW